MKVSVLGIGTELTDGQIINRNGPWISGQLKKAGVPTTLHLVVPDEHSLMRKALELCATESEVIFVTGGLGPTSDDFTRDIVAEWMNAKLQFHQASWDHLTQRLTSRGYTVKEIQRQQCYFPEGAEVLFNTEGTANAFKVLAHGKTVFVLPGPPREIEAVWKSSIASWVQEHTQHLDPVVTRMWDTLGKGESDIASIAEEALQGANIEKGYRVHLPYVEVKLTFKKSEAAKNQVWVDRLTEALAPYTALRDGQDIASEFAKKIEGFSSLKIVDGYSGTFLWQRLSTPLRGFMEKKKWSFSNEETPAPADLELCLAPQGAFGAEVTLKYEAKTLKENFVSPYTTANMQERAKQFLAERALIFWTQNLP